MNTRMNRESSSVNGVVAFDNLAFVVDPDEIRRLDQAKAHAEAVHPEGIGELRIARGDVTGDPLVESEFCEKPKSAASRSFLCCLSSASVLKTGGCGRPTFIFVAALVC